MHLPYLFEFFKKNGGRKVAQIIYSTPEEMHCGPGIVVEVWLADLKIMAAIMSRDYFQWHNWLKVYAYIMGNI